MRHTWAGAVSGYGSIHSDTLPSAQQSQVCLQPGMERKLGGVRSTLERRGTEWVSFDCLASRSTDYSVVAK